MRNNFPKDSLSFSLLCNGKVINFQSTSSYATADGREEAKCYREIELEKFRLVRQQFASTQNWLQIILRASASFHIFCLI